MFLSGNSFPMGFFFFSCRKTRAVEVFKKVAVGSSSNRKTQYYIVFKPYAISVIHIFPKTQISAHSNHSAFLICKCFKRKDTHGKHKQSRAINYTQAVPSGFDTFLNCIPDLLLNRYLYQLAYRKKKKKKKTFIAIRPVQTCDRRCRTWEGGGQEGSIPTAEQAPKMGGQ